MFKKTISIIYIIYFCFFIVSIVNFYFSEANIIKTNKSRDLYIFNLNKQTQDLPLLKNDTNKVIEFRTDIEIYKENKKEYKFWDLINK